MNSDAIISKSKNIFSIFFSISGIYIKFRILWKRKDEPGRLFVSEIIDYKKRCYLNAEKAAYLNTYGQLKC